MEVLRMKRRAAGFIMALIMLLTVGTPLLTARPMAADNIYFTAVNDNLCPLNDETMPFWSGGNLYVASTVFSSYDLGLSYARDTSAQTAVLYNKSKVLEFDLANGGANNTQGTYYSARAVSRGGYIFFPLAFVCSYFGLSYSLRDTSWIPLVRVCGGAILSDSQFIDAASTLMASRYYAYRQSKNPGSSTAVDDQPDNSGNETQNVPQQEETEQEDTKSTARVLLAIRAEGDEPLASMLNTLDRYGYQATIFFDPAALEGRDDMLRRIISSGHRIGLVQTSGGRIDPLEEGNEQIRACTGTTTRLVLSSYQSAAQNAGYAVYVPTVSAQTMGATASSRASRIFSAIERSSGTVKLLLGGDETTAEALPALCARLQQGDYTVRSVNETACA